MPRVAALVSMLPLWWLLLLGLLQGASAQFDIFSLGESLISQAFGSRPRTSSSPSSSSTLILLGPPQQRTSSRQATVQAVSSTSVFVAPRPSVPSLFTPSTSSSVVPVITPSSTPTPTSTLIPSSTSQPPQTSAPVVPPVLATTSSKVSSALPLTRSKAPVISSSSSFSTTSLAVLSSETPSFTLTRAAASATTTGSAKGSSGPKAGAIAGAVIGVLVGLALIAALVWFLLRRRKNRDDGDSLDYAIQEKNFNAPEPPMPIPDPEETPYRGLMPVPSVSGVARTATFPANSAVSPTSPTSPIVAAAVLPLDRRAKYRSGDNPFISENERNSPSPTHSASSMAASPSTAKQVVAAMPEPFVSRREQAARNRRESAQMSTGKAAAVAHVAELASPRNMSTTSKSEAVASMGSKSGPKPTVTELDAPNSRSGSPVPAAPTPGGLVVMNPDEKDTRQSQDEEITALPVFKSESKRQSTVSVKPVQEEVQASTVQGVKASTPTNRQGPSEVESDAKPTVAAARPSTASGSDYSDKSTTSAPSRTSHTSDRSERQSTGAAAENPFDPRYSTTSSNRSSSSAILYADLDQPHPPTYRGPLDSHAAPSYQMPQYQTPYQQQAYQQRGPPRVAQWRGTRQNDMPSIAESHDYDYGYGNRGFPQPPRRGRGRGGYGPGYGPPRTNVARRPVGGSQPPY